MKKLLQSFLCASLLFVVGAAKADSCCNDAASNDCCDCTCSSIFIPRSVGDNLVRQATYRNFKANSELADDCCWGNAIFGADFRYQRSRDGDKIAKSLFGSSVLTFQGSDTKAGNLANVNALLADNFGLASDTNQQLGFCPRIVNNVIDFELYFELNSWCNGLFMQFNAPVSITKFQLRAYDAGAGVAATVLANNCDNSCNNSCDTGCSTNCNSTCGQALLPAATGADFCSGYMGRNGGDALETVRSAASYENALSGNFLFGDMQTPWNAGRFHLGAIAEDTKLASFNMILGYNAWECEDYNLGIFLRAAAPTGTNVTCCNLDYNCNDAVFAPQIGDNHWKLGGGLTGRYELYNCDDNHFVTIYAEGYAEHLFKRCQVRSFDFTGKGCLSRYMLLKEFDGTAYTGNLINGINFATRSVKTSVDVQGEGQIELGYRNNCGFSAGLGWNIYGKSGEKACTIGNPCDSSVLHRTYGFKGCTQVENVCIAVETNTSGATIISAGPVVTASLNNGSASASDARNCGAIDTVANQTTALPANGQSGTLCLDACGLVLPAAGAAVTAFNNPAGTVTIGGVVDSLSQVSTTPATFTTATDNLDINSGLAHSQITNKVFGHLDYQWEDCKYSPKAYVGGEVEFASENRCAGMNAWAIYLGGSLNF